MPEKPIRPTHDLPYGKKARKRPKVKVVFLKNKGNKARPAAGGEQNGKAVTKRTATIQIRGGRRRENWVTLDLFGTRIESLIDIQNDLQGIFLEVEGGCFRTSHAPGWGLGTNDSSHLGKARSARRVDVLTRDGTVH